MFAFMCSMGLWKTRFAIGTKASGLSLTKPSWLSQHDQPTTLHTLDRDILVTSRSCKECVQHQPARAPF